MKPRGLGWRLFWTIAPVVAVLCAARLILLPGAPGAGGVFDLGVMPAVSAYIAVEVLAFLVPALRRMRHGNPAGRRKLERAARALALGIAVFQAWGVARSIAAIDDTTMIPPAFSIPIAIASLVGGFCVMLLVADLVTSQGIVNGIVFLAVTSSFAAMVTDVRAGFGKGMVAGSLEPRHGVVIVAALAITIVATVIALRPAAHARGTRTAASEGPTTAYRDARALVAEPWVPTPASSFAPYPVAASLVSLPAVLRIHAIDKLGDLGFGLLFGGTMMVVALILARILHRPSELTDLARRLGIATEAASEDKAKAARRRALVPTLLYLLTFFLATSAAGLVPHLRLSMMVVPPLVALVMDAALAIRARDRVAVWEERRIAAVPIVRAVLEAEGIATSTRGTAVLALFQAFVPYAPAEILVAREDAERATAILAHLLLGEAAPARSPETKTHVPAGPDIAAWSRRATIALALTACAAGGAYGVASMRRTYDGPPPRRASLEVVRIDDTQDPLGKIHPETVPDYMELRWENAPTGSNAYGRTTSRVQFARISLEPGAREAADQWMSRLALPEGTRIAWERTDVYDEESRTFRPDGYRSYLLTGEPILTTDDVVDAEAMVTTQSGTPEVYVAITLGGDAALRFADVTREWTNRRFAIILDGTINSAPVVRSAIYGGKISVTMGAGDPEKQLAQARTLARGLTGR